MVYVTIIRNSHFFCSLKCGRWMAETVKISFQCFQQFSVWFESCGSSVFILVSISVIFFLIEHSTGLFESLSPSLHAKHPTFSQPVISFQYTTDLLIIISYYSDDKFLRTASFFCFTECFPNRNSPWHNRCPEGLLNVKVNIFPFFTF